MKHGGENDAAHHRGAHHGAWVALAVLVDAHIGIEICLSCAPFVGSNHPYRTVLCWSLVIPAEELLVTEHHARQVQGLLVPFATDGEHAHALQHVTAKFQPCQAVLCCQSRRTDGLEAPRLEIFMQRPATELSATCPASCADGARSESAAASRSRPFRSRPKPHSFAAASADGDSSGAPRRSCLSFVLILSSDQSGRIASISRGFRPSSSHWRS